MKAIFAVALVAALCIVPTQCMFEDQAGLTDWVKQHVGAPQHAIAGGNSRVFVATSASVVACLDGDSGSVNWRQVLPEDHVVESMALHKKRLALLTSTASGAFVRLFYAPSGELVWDAALDFDTPIGPDDATPHLAFTSSASGNINVVVAVGGSVTVLSVKKGAEAWTWTAPQECDASLLQPATSASKSLTLLCGQTAYRLSTVVGDSGSALESTSELAEADAYAVLTAGTDAIVASIKDGQVTFVQPETGASATLENVKDAEALQTFGASAPSTVVVHTQAGSQVAVTVSSGSAVAVGADGSAAAGSEGLTLKVEGTFEAAQAVGATAHGKRVTVAAATAGSSSTSVDFVSGGERSKVSAEAALDGSVDTVFVLPFRPAIGGVAFRFMLVSPFDAVGLVHSNDGLLWVHEEALAATTEVHIVDAGDVAVESESDEVDLSFAGRIVSQVEDLKAHIQGAVDFAKDPLGALKGQWSQAVYRFSKTIVAVTESGKLFGVEAQTGETRWGTTAVAADGAKVFTTRARQTGSHPPEVLVLHRTDLQRETGGMTCTFLDTEDGSVLHTETVDVAPGALRAATLLSAEDSTHRHVMLLADGEGKVFVVPSTDDAVAAFETQRKEFVYAVVDSEDASVKGYTVYGAAGDYSSEEVWAMQFPEGETPVATGAADSADQVRVPARILGDGGLLVKYLNPNLFVVATTGEKEVKSKSGSTRRVPTVTIYTLDAVSGRTIDARTHHNAVGPIMVLVHENWVQYSYWNAKAKWQELASLVMYEASLGNRDLNPFKPPENSGDFSSFHAVDPLVNSQIFVLPTTVSTLGVTRTAKAITDRMLLLGLDAGSLMAMDRRFVDPRRPTGAATPAQKAEGLATYTPHLPLPHGALLSYNQTVLRIRSIASSPTALESTTTVVAAGLDMFGTRIQPSKDFDILAEDFNKPLLLLLTTGLLVATVLVKRALNSKRLKEAWQ